MPSGFSSGKSKVVAAPRVLICIERNFAAAVLELWQRPPKVEKGPFYLFWKLNCIKLYHYISDTDLKTIGFKLSPLS